LRPLQEQLASFGLSSLGRAESQVAANIDAVQRALCCMARRPFNDLKHDRSEFAIGKRLLENNTVALLGPTPSERTVRIMVTMPSEAASDYARPKFAQWRNELHVHQRGPDHEDACLAHMVQNLRRARREIGQPCSVLMDLPGPKLRTGPTEVVPGVIKLRPKRDRYGKVIGPAKIWLTPMGKPQPDAIKADAILTVPSEWLSRLETGQQINFRDARGKLRAMKVTTVIAGNRVAESNQTSYLTSETILRVLKNGAPIGCPIGEIPPISQPIILKPGDVLHLLPVQDAGRSAERDKQGQYLQPPSIGVTLPEIFSDVRPGENIWFDDGKLAA
jgi:pyruvate kinase